MDLVVADDKEYSLYYPTMLNHISVKLDREEINELGRPVPYLKYAKFPVEITAPIELYKNIDGFWLNHIGEMTYIYCKEHNHPYYYGRKIIQGL